MGAAGVPTTAVVVVAAVAFCLPLAFLTGSFKLVVLSLLPTFLVPSLVIINLLLVAHATNINFM